MLDRAGVQPDPLVALGSAAAIMEAAAGNLKRVSVELGGHAPFVVFPDADPVRAAKGAAAPARSRKASQAQGPNPADPSTWGKVARNTPCPCGSGRKYKHCHGLPGR